MISWRHSHLGRFWSLPLFEYVMTIASYCGVFGWYVAWMHKVDQRKGWVGEGGGVKLQFG